LPHRRPRPQTAMSMRPRVCDGQRDLTGRAAACRSSRPQLPQALRARSMVASPARH
jgi:hypothetical protein